MASGIHRDHLEHPVEDFFGGYAWQVGEAIRANRGDQTSMLLRAHIEISQAEVRKITLHQVHLARNAVR